MHWHKMKKIESCLSIWGTNVKQNSGNSLSRLQDANRIPNAKNHVFCAPQEVLSTKWPFKQLCKPHPIGEVW
jgi:hypothetical protein